MNDRDRLRAGGDENDADKAPRGVNLALVYGLMLLALLIAIGLATLIVLPFYHHR
ncbi:MAG TPA: hypothetical protein VG225_08360 [Terracidiphilus sp.]|jgi:hypothetical protein|nr:hypothetical protein [Terracidiphilus sp.]